MNLRKHFQRRVEDVRGITADWTEFYTLLPCRTGYIVWDEAKADTVKEVGGAARIFSYIEALKYACTAPRVLCGWDTINTRALS